jgi:hypothetical protein
MKSSQSVPLFWFIPGSNRLLTVPVLWASEIRAILPAWIIFISVSSAGFFLKEFWQNISMYGYLIGCSAIGAIISGHDFSDGTLITTLSQPLHRDRLWRIRLGIAAVLTLPILIVTAVQSGVPGDSGGAESGLPVLTWIIFSAPFLVGLFVAPCLTILTRSPLAGTVFTVGLPFLFWFLGDLIAAIRFGRIEETTGVYRSFQQMVTCVLLIGGCVAGATSGWKSFLHLEAADLRRSMWNIRLIPRPWHPSTAAASHGPGSASWELVKKEFRLYILTILPVAALILLSLLSHFPKIAMHAEMVSLAAVFSGFLICIVIGGLASAEEKQLGLAESQALLPISKSWQWTIKVVIAGFQAFFAGTWLPLLVIQNAHTETSFPPELVFTFTSFIIMLISLYVSSCCRNTMKAIVISLPACWSVLAVLGFATAPFWKPLPQTAEQLFGFDSESMSRLGLCGIVFITFGGLTFQAACANHFSADRGAARLIRQALKIGLATFCAWLGAMLLYTFVP